MATVLTMGEIIDVTSDAATGTYSFGEVGKERGCLVNEDGPDTAYVNWMGTGTVVADKTAGTNKNYISRGSGVRIPKNCKQFSIATASGQAAKVQYVEDLR